VTSFARTPTSVSLRVSSYDNFQGIDTSRDARSMETGSDQHFVLLKNCHADWRGQITRDPGATKLAGDFPVRHIDFASSTDPVWVEQDDAGMNLVSLSGARVDAAFTGECSATSTVFGKRVIIACRGSAPYVYQDGAFSQNLSPAMNLILMPDFLSTVSRRLAVAGVPGQETVVHLSRVDNADVMPDDEEPGDTNVLRAGTIDIANLTGNADFITGLGSFENNRLLIFTQDRAITYIIDADIDEWKLDDTTNIQIGCISHNTIHQAGNDVLFCSRSGIHSIKRSQDNGILAYSKTLSEKIADLYTYLVSTVEDPQTITATFDPDKGQYHVFFPTTYGPSRRLTLTLNPERGEEAEPKFSTADFLTARCGAFLGGNLLFGTPGGVYKILKATEEVEGAITPEAEIVFPYFWHGSLTENKDIHSLIIQAIGKGTITLTATRDDGAVFDAMTMEVEGSSDDSLFVDVPLSTQYERPFQHRYLSAQYRLAITGGAGLLRLVGFAVLIRK